jgi:hypothetical protein
MIVSTIYRATKDNKKSGGEDGGHVKVAKNTNVKYCPRMWIEF